MLLQKLTIGTGGANAQNRIWLVALSLHPPSTVSSFSGRWGLSCHLTPQSPYLNQSPLLPVLRLFRTVQFIVHFWELVLEIPDLSLMLFPFHLHLKQPDKKGSLSETLFWALLIFTQSVFRPSNGQEESSKDPRNLSHSLLPPCTVEQGSTNYGRWAHLAHCLFL